MIDYSPLWDTMKRRQISQYYLLQHGIQCVHIHQAAVVSDSFGRRPFCILPLSYILLLKM